MMEEGSLITIVSMIKLSIWIRPLQLLIPFSFIIELLHLLLFVHVMHLHTLIAFVSIIVAFLSATIECKLAHIPIVLILR